MYNIQARLNIGQSISDDLEIGKINRVMPKIGGMASTENKNKNSVLSSSIIDYKLKTPQESSTKKMIK